ncbi:MAG: hypothetical protein GX803_05540 [Lentisphaerae bacterium]|jgi:hypothetical protein|nr:hypothetical protein [Lentisphaerota bacterium]
MPETTATSPSAKLRRRPKVRREFRYRWGVTGVALALGLFFWYLHTSGRLDHKPAGSMQYYEKLVCPRCNNEPPARDECIRCGGKGSIWVDTRIDPGPTPQPVNEPKTP